MTRSPLTQLLPQLLFVDDEDGVLQYVSSNLQSFGYDVLTSTDWNEAQTLLKDPDVQPELIFIEPLLTENNGSPSLQEICADVEQTPVIVLSTSRDPQALKICLHSFFKTLQLESSNLYN